MTGLVTRLVTRLEQGLLQGKRAVNDIAQSVAFQQIGHVQDEPGVLFQPVDDARGGNGIAAQIKKVVLSGERAVIAKAVTYNLKQYSLIGLVRGPSLLRRCRCRFCNPPAAGAPDA